MDGAEISSSSKWGGARANSGGARANSGGARANSGGARANSGGLRPGAGRKRRRTMPPPVDIPANEEVLWYCVCVTPRLRHVAETELRRLGLPTFFPAIRRQAPAWARRSRPDVLLPMFPGYAFVAFAMTDTRWRLIHSRPGVERLISAGPECPQAIPQAMIDIIRDQCGPDGVASPAPKSGIRGDVVEGDVVALAKGPFAGFRGICCMTAKARLKVLIEVFGRATEIDIRRTDVEVVA